MAASQLHCCYQARPHLFLQRIFSACRPARLPSFNLYQFSKPPIQWLGLSMCAREVFVKESVQEKSALESADHEAHSDTHLANGNGYVTVDDGDERSTLGHDEDDDDETETSASSLKQDWDDDAIMSAKGVYGEVSKIIASRSIDHSMFYLIEWKDGHEPSWLPSSSIAKDVLAEYEGNWWKAARAGDDAKLKELLTDEARDVDAVDENGRTALLFAAGIGSDKCIQALVEAGADVDGQDPDGLTPLHMATGYARQSCVAALVELGADPELADSKGRTPITLAQELIDRIPKANPLQFARRVAMENILKLLESEVFDTVEVEQVLDRRSAGNGKVEYFVKWKDGAPEEWIDAENVADDLIQDYEAGLEYGIAEEILEKRDKEGKVEYLVRWADAEEPTWEPFENVAAELIADYEKTTIAEVEKKQQKLSEK
ncbi:hypothetical protein GOP47_0002827 [Adiantum capillus-veneris]|uniref:Chromo domain-containing protein n=1 Tax=Adiantum capillus-veneris TaxID=13818 RepID=A0A9D4VB27_ADICA|nr:hypothetical protein GOP47_0002827 [Adiantum capillus-veneris]